MRRVLTCVYVSANTVLKTLSTITGNDKRAKELSSARAAESERWDVSYY